ncbi:hypothetical protein E2C01_044050 [Portunus trituberculatus]|uniref:Uncharacterized protein n=1 Tax=Portunus trituberculatus TaxID=210409 RepID=A0A5B7FXB8_PORTR|nr:hypothetical protein [Portunus trituberculatus]
MNHPSAPAPLINNLTLAVYPSHPSLLLIIANEISYFKAARVWASGLGNQDSNPCQPSCPVGNVAFFY